MNSSIEQAVRAALETLRPGIEVRGDTDLTRELGLDSIQVMDLVMEIEDRLDISVPAETLADIRTFDQLCASIAPLMASGEPAR